MNNTGSGPEQTSEDYPSIKVTDNGYVVEWYNRDTKEFEKVECSKTDTPHELSIKMSKFAVFFCALVSFCAHAETYLCVAEAGAVVLDGGREGIKAGLADVSNNKYIQTNDSGKWLVKELGQDSALFDLCSSQFFCEHASGYAGVFMRTPSSGVFSVTYMVRKNGANQLVVAKGRCTKL